MVWVEKDFPYFLANGAPPRFSGYFTVDAFLGEIFLQALNLGGLTAPLDTFESNKERQLYDPPNESESVHKLRFNKEVSFRRKPESSVFESLWMPDHVRHDGLTDFKQK